MMRFIKAILFLFGAYLLFRAYCINSIYLNGIDGDGIGIYLLGIEINDRVPTEKVPEYVKGFALLGSILIIAPVINRLFRKKTT